VDALEPTKETEEDLPRRSAQKEKKLCKKKLGGLRLKVRTALSAIKKNVTKNGGQQDAIRTLGSSTT